MTTTVTTQEELDAALADPDVYRVEIHSEQDVWLRVRKTQSHVVARGQSHVEAWEQSHVVAREQSHVEARGQSHVEAREQSHVEAREQSSLHGYHHSEITAGSHVAVHLHSGTCRVQGGVLIDHTAVDQSDPATWCSYHGVEVDADDGVALLYKAVRQDWRSAHGTSYEPGTTASCDDFRADGDCGHGLHVSPSPTQAKAYDHEATRYVEVHVPLAGINVIGPDKCKATCMRCVREVDLYGQPVAAETTTVGVSA